MSRKVKLLGLGEYLPQKVTNKELEPLFGAKAVKVLSQALGIEERHYVVNLKTGSLDLKISDLATRAALNALNNAGIKVDAVDIVVLSTCTPHYSIPATVTFVLDELGMSNCATIEIRSGCAGFGQAVTVASQFIQNGTYETALVIGCELTSTQLVPLITEPQLIKKCRLEDLLNFIVFGDGAGAVVLQASDNEENIKKSCIGTVGINQKPGFTLAGPVDAMICDASTVIERFRRLRAHDYSLTRENFQIMAETAISHITRMAAIDCNEINKFIVPLATPQIVEAIAEKFCIPLHKIISIASTIGQIANASIPVTLTELHKKSKIKPGEQVVLIMGENTKWTYCCILLTWPMLNAYSSLQEN